MQLRGPASIRGGLFGVAADAHAGKVHPENASHLVVVDRIGHESPAGRKRPRMVWTPALHSAFVAVVQELGVESAVPKAIMQVPGVRVRVRVSG